MTVSETAKLLKIADKLEEQAQSIRLSVAKIQREDKTERSQEFYNIIDEVNKLRQESGLPQIIPLITDSL